MSRLRDPVEIVEIETRSTQIVCHKARLVRVEIVNGRPLTGTAAPLRRPSGRAFVPATRAGLGGGGRVGGRYGEGRLATSAGRATQTQRTVRLGANRAATRGPCHPNRPYHMGKACGDERRTWPGVRRGTLCRGPRPHRRLVTEVSKPCYGRVGCGGEVAGPASAALQERRRERGGRPGIKHVWDKGDCRWATSEGRPGRTT